MKKILPLITALFLLLVGYAAHADAMTVNTAYDYDTQRLIVSVVDGVSVGETLSILVAKYQEETLNTHTMLTEANFSQNVVYVRQHIYDGNTINIPLSNAAGGTYAAYVSAEGKSEPASSVFEIDANVITHKTYESFEDTSVKISATMREVVYSQEKANAGTTSLKAVGKPGDGWAKLTFSNLNLMPNKTYTVHFWASSSGDVNAVSASLCHANENALSGKEVSMPSGSWGQYSFTVTVPDSWMQTYLTIDLRGAEDIYLDDLVIYEGILDKQTQEYEETEFTDICEGTDSFYLYVNPDAVPGGDGSYQNPFATIVEARDYVRTINDDMNMNITVYLMGGTYEITDTIELTDEDSGTNGHYIIYKAYRDEEVIISGGDRIENWTVSEIDGVYQATGVHAPNARNLYVNGEKAQRAKYDGTVTPISWWNDTSDSRSEKDGFVIPGGIIKHPKAATNLEIFKTITFRSNWAVKGKATESGDNTVLSFAQPWFGIHEKANYSILTWETTDDFRLENALEFLDQPGEWFLDIDTDILYYMPKAEEDIFDSEIILPKLEQLFIIRGSNLNQRAQNIIVDGITFAHGGNDHTSNYGRTGIQGTQIYDVDDTYLYQTLNMQVKGNLSFENAENILLRNNTVKHMSSVGIRMLSGVENCAVTGNVIYDISSAAVSVGDSYSAHPADWRMIPKNIRIDNNIMHDLANEYYMDPGITVYYADGVDILHNEIYDTRYSAISVGWGWTNELDSVVCRNNNISYNRVYNFMRSMRDGGGIYTLGQQPDSVVSYNYVAPFVRDAQAIYHDEGSDFFLTEYNVCDMPAATTAHWAHIHTVPQNIVLNHNYSNHEAKSDIAGGTVEQNTHYELGGAFSENALQIIQNSGLKEAYRKLREKIPGYSEDVTVKRLNLVTEDGTAAQPIFAENGQTVTFRVYAFLSNGDFYEVTEDCSFGVSDSAIANFQGPRLTCHTSGTTTAYVCYGDTEAMVSVIVNNANYAVELIADTTSLHVGDKVKANYLVNSDYWQEGVFARGAQLHSSDTGVVAITSDGYLIAKAPGHVTLTLTVNCQGEEFCITKNIIVYDRKTTVYQNEDAVGSLTAQTLEAYFGETVSEARFAKLLCALMEKNNTDFTTLCDVREIPLTNEKMAEIAVVMLRKFYGNCYQGDLSLALVADRTEITPGLVPYVASALEYELWETHGQKICLQPKNEVTPQAAVQAVLRLMVPKNIRTILRGEDDFSKYGISEKLTRNNRSDAVRGINSQVDAVFGTDIVKDINYADDGNGSGSFTFAESYDEGGYSYQFSKTAVNSTIVLKQKNAESREVGLRLEAGKNYILSVRVKLAKEHQKALQNMTLRVVQNGVTVGDLSKVFTKIGANDWKQCELNITSDTDLDNAGIYLTFGNVSGDTTTNYKVLFDDIILYEVPDSEPIFVQNGVQVALEDITAGELLVYYTWKNREVTALPLDFYLACYDNHHKLSDVAVDSQTVDNGEQRVFFASAEVPDGGVVQLFLWNSQTLKPYFAND